MKGFHKSASGAIQGHHGPLVYIISLFVAEFEEAKIGISGKGLMYLNFKYPLRSACAIHADLTGLKGFAPSHFSGPQGTSVPFGAAWIKAWTEC